MLSICLRSRFFIAAVAIVLLLGSMVIFANGEQGDDFDADEEPPFAGLDLTEWVEKHRLGDWPFEWEPIIHDASHQDTPWKPGSAFERDLESVVEGRVAGQRVIVFLPGCLCSSMVTSVHVFSEGGARLSLDTRDTVTEVAFSEGRLYLTWEDDPDSPNCCATRFRHSVWLLDGARFNEVEAWWAPVARPLETHWRPGSDTQRAPAMSSM